MRTPWVGPYLVTLEAFQAIAADRAYPDKLPQHDQGGPTRQPCVVYARSNVETQQLFCGEDSLVKVVMQVDAYALVYDDAEALADVVKKALVGFTGQMGPVIVDTLQVDTESNPGPEPDPGLFRVFQSFIIWCREA